ncbi:PIN domain-containing protein [Mucilaginibacter sp.]|uniref:PIN domain-containing protein n=1 Tax=Mucilaginibacter sp. TaxID=1882438 RepID=UPI003266075D
MELVCRNLFIDTQYFVNKSFDFKSKELLSLIELAQNDFITVYLTDITEQEIKKKIKDVVSVAYEKINLSDARILKYIPAFTNFLKESPEAKSTEYLRDTFEQFKSDCKIEIISSDQIKLKEIFKSYCLNEPPFNSQPGKNRKSEFPDAFALATINQWVNSTNQKTYVISGDSDWKTYISQTVRKTADIKAEKRLFDLEDMSELLNTIIRHEKSLEDITAFADNLVDTNKEIIQQYIAEKLKWCGYDGVSMEEEVDITDVHILFVEIAERDIISVDREGATYHITLNVHAVFNYDVTQYGPYDNEDKRYLGIEYINLYQHHIFDLSVDVEFSFADAIPLNFEIESADIPADIEIDYDEGEYIELAEWVKELRVMVNGVIDGKKTEDGRGFQEFTNIAHARKYFPELDIYKSSGNFTEAFGNKISEPLRFETGLSYFLPKD